MKNIKKNNAVKGVSKNKDSMLQKMLTSRGFYIAAVSLAVIVGFTVYARRIQSDVQNEVASFDDNAWKTAVEESGYQIVDTDSTKPTTDQTPAVKKDEPKNHLRNESEAVATSAKPKQGTETPKFSMQLPCDGAVIAECSVDELVYCETMEDWRTHNGMDIAAKVGDPVKAAANGTVSEVYKDELLGVVVEIDHGDGISSLYANLQNSDFISVGKTVQAGDIIGGVGESGALEANAEPHLHFEVKKNNEYKNPKEYIKN